MIPLHSRTKGTYEVLDGWTIDIEIRVGKHDLARKAKIETPSNISVKNIACAQRIVMRLIGVHQVMSRHSNTLQDKPPTSSVYACCHSACKFWLLIIPICYAGIKKRGIKPGQRRALLDEAKAKAQQLANKVTS